MNESSDEPPLFLDRVKSWARHKAHASNFNPFGASDSDRDTLPTTTTTSASKDAARRQPSGSPTAFDSNAEKLNDGRGRPGDLTGNDNAGSNGSSTSPAPATTSHETAGGETASSVASNDAANAKPNIAIRFCRVSKDVLLSSWVNVLLVFVPVGIALGAMDKSAPADQKIVSPSVVFAMNAIAIIPLAGLLSYATENVASKMGDTIGALLNVTFGNAVELIIFIIALVANEIRIVQASLLGSILANLLLILGMSFLFGGLRFREQVRLLRLIGLPALTPCF